jgi:hypothetical protein
MGILHAMRSDLAVLFKIYFGLSSSGSGDCRCGENPSAVPEIRKGDQQTAVPVKDYLKGLDP